MEIKLDKLTIISFDSKNLEHNRFKYRLSQDKDFSTYITKNIDNRLKPIDYDENELKIDNSYIVKYDNELIGYIRLDKIDNNKLLEIEYSVSPNYRGKQLGTLILKEVSDYILKNIENIKGIKLAIRKNNYISKHVAENNKYIKYDQDDETAFYRKNK